MDTATETANELSSMPEERLVRETGLALRIAGIAEPVLADLDLRLVRVRLTGQNATTVQIMAERADGTMTIADCERVSRALSPVFDVEDPLPGGYVLEVSSPGIDRPLVRPTDFERWAGYDAKIELTEMLAGRKRYRGVLEGFDDGEVRIYFSEKDGDEPVLIGLPFSLIDNAKLVMTDRLLEEAARGRTAPDTPGDN